LVVLCPRHVKTVLLAEMFAYCIGAAHVQLPHQFIDSLMVSAIDADGEGLVDKIPAWQVCRFAKNIKHDQHAVPPVLHLCQRYFVNEWFFSKRKIPPEVFDCDQPLLMEPPEDLNVAEVDMDEGKAHREAFILCHTLAIMNEAATFYKQNACPTTGNFEKTWHFI
jgi:hypothetical protein